MSPLTGLENSLSALGVDNLQSCPSVPYLTFRSLPGQTGDTCHAMRGHREEAWTMNQETRPQGTWMYTSYPPEVAEIDKPLSVWHYAADQDIPFLRVSQTCLRLAFPHVLHGPLAGPQGSFSTFSCSPSFCCWDHLFPRYFKH